MVILIIVQVDILLSSLLGTDQVSGMLWYMVYIVLFAVPEHVHDCHCCSNHFSVLYLVFCLISLGLVFVFPILCDWWPFDEICNIYNLIAWSSLDALQFGILSTCEDIILMNRCEPSTVAHTALMFFFCFLVLCSLFFLSFFEIVCGRLKC
jgi:hypothetical protein